MAKKQIKVPLTPFQKLIKSHEVQLRRLEEELADMRKVFDDDSAALKKKIEARKEVLSKLRQ